MSDKQVLEAVAVVLKDIQRDIDKRIDGLDPAAISKSVAVENHQQLEATFLKYLDSFQNERSEVLDGTPNAVLTRCLR